MKWQTTVLKFNDWECKQFVFEIFMLMPSRYVTTDDKREDIKFREKERKSWWYGIKPRGIFTFLQTETSSFIFHSFSFAFKTKVFLSRTRDLLFSVSPKMYTLSNNWKFVFAEQPWHFRIIKKSADQLRITIHLSQEKVYCERSCHESNFQNLSSFPCSFINFVTFEWITPSSCIHCYIHLSLIF